MFAPIRTLIYLTAMSPRTAKSEKEHRQSTLIKIIQTKDLHSQEELVREMSDKGFSCTQTTISRDLLELKVMKVGGFYRVSEGTAASELNRVLLDHVSELDVSGNNLVVLKGKLGTAGIVAAALDSSDTPGIVGSIAGDDTVFIAVKSPKYQEKILKSFQAILSKKLQSI